MKYIAIFDTDEIEDFAFFEDGKEKYLHGIDANSENGEWIYLPFKPLNQKLDELKANIERLKHKNSDISGYRWWNNAIENCLCEIDRYKESEKEE